MFRFFFKDSPCRCLFTPACEERSNYSVVLEMTGLRCFVNMHSHRHHMFNGLLIIVNMGVKRLGLKIFCRQPYICPGLIT